MEAKSNRIGIALLRSVITGNQLSLPERELFAVDLLPRLFAISQKHDVSHLVGQSLFTEGLINCEKTDSEEAYSKIFHKAQLMAIYRHEQISYEFTKLYAVLKSEKIYFLPLKGTVMKRYYPEPWMRTSCDIDILVQEEKLEEAAEALVTQLGYTREKKSNHDISLISPNGVHLELHYRAIDEGRFPNAQTVLNRIWQEATPAEDSVYQRELPDEMFYFYHIVHMAKHIENGGCGIRPFLDLWILNHRVPHVQEKRNELLEKGNLVDFAYAVEKLSEVWFSNAESNEMTQKLEKYILYGGTYGVLENRISVSQSKLGGKVEYALQKIFLPYDRIKYHYPILQKYRVLTPIFEVVRWFKLLFKGGVKRSIRELRVNEDVARKGRNEVKELLEYLGL